MMVALMICDLAGGPAWISHQNIIIHHYQMTCYQVGVRLVWHGKVIRKSSEHHHSPLPDDL
jgi:hypothetical protein